jgi:hypothetical protein
MVLEKIDERLIINDFNVVGTLLDPTLAKVPLIVEYITSYLMQQSLDAKSFILKK